VITLIVDVSSSGSGLNDYYIEAKKFVEENYNYAPWKFEEVDLSLSDVNQILVWLCSIVSMVGITLIFGGSTIFDALGMAEPRFMQFINNNKTMSFVVMFVCYSIGNNIRSSGAFELYVDDELMFSKLAMGRLPGVQDMVKIFAQVLGIELDEGEMEGAD